MEMAARTDVTSFEGIGLLWKTDDAECGSSKEALELVRSLTPSLAEQVRMLYAGRTD